MKIKLILTLIAVSFSLTNLMAQGKPKVWIYSDMSDRNIKGSEKEGSANDPDDISAMAGYLIMSNEFDTKGIVVASTHRKEHVASPNQADWANRFFGDAYRVDLINLNKRIGGYQKDLNFIQSSIKSTSEHYRPGSIYKTLKNYPSIKPLFDLAQSSKEPINVLIWGSTTEPAILVNYCINNGYEKVLSKLRFIAHWTNSSLHQGTLENPERVANCREDSDACSYLKEQASVGKIIYHELGAIGQHGIVSGQPKGDDYYNQFKTSRLGTIFAEGKFAHNGVDHSDAATYWVLLANWGVSLDDIAADRTNPAETEKSNEEKFKVSSDRIHGELLRRSKIAAN